MKYSESLKKNRDFQLVYKQGTSFANRFLVMYVKKNQLGRNRIGISVSKKVGNSVVRHHLARLIRESYRLHEEEFQCGMDVVVIARVNAKNCTYFEYRGSPYFASGKTASYIKGNRKMKTVLIKVSGLSEYLSPLKRVHCPYTPTCSQYGLEAIQKYGAFKGSLLALWRILRCNPFSHGGYDPVP